MGTSTIQERLKTLREKHFGRRGRRSFAVALGIAPSTYHRYEIDRDLPAALAAKACAITGADLQWLLTGQSGTAGPPVGFRQLPILERFLALLADRPGAAAAVEAFLGLLEKHGDMTEEGLGRHADEAVANGLVAEVEALLRRGEWLPVLGRTAAGVPHFWDRDPGMVAQLNSAFAQLSEPPAASRRTRADQPDQAASKPQRSVLLQASQPCRVGDLSVTEFIAAPPVKQGCPDAFALRVDGASMSPTYRDGDLVVLSPSRAAQDGRAAVVQLRNQIGVTCKIYRKFGDQVHLIPINEQYRATEHAASDVVWALEVLYRIRPR